MDNFLLIGGWVLYWNLIHPLVPLMGITRNTVWERAQTPTPEHLRFPAALLSLSLLCGISMLVWGFIHLRWFMALANVGAGLLLAPLVVMFVETKSRFLLVKFGWFPLVILNGYLWFRGFIR